ncbi:MAG: hypothetical protein SFY80_13500 [Verrucomicrobiota bacterium]|nr:hypothetical protein [Verrucomicrobiota bacterium]
MLAKKLNRKSFFACGLGVLAGAYAVCSTITGGKTKEIAEDSEVESGERARLITKAEQRAVPQSVHRV